MSNHVHPQNICEYSEIVVCPVRAQNLHTNAIAAALHHLFLLYREQLQDYQYFRFNYRIIRLLYETLIFRGYLNIIFVSGRYEMNILL